MAPKVEYVFKNFLPPAGPQPAKPQVKSPPVQGGANAADGSVERHRALGQYGFNLLHVIEKDYERQISLWRDAFSDIVAAFATAVDKRDKILQRVKEERERGGAFETFIFSLLTAGAMRFVGAFLQYNFFGKISFPNHTYKWDHYHWTDGLPAMTKVPLPPTEFPKYLAAAFGGIAQDLGNRLIPLTFPKPRPVEYQVDSFAGIMNLQADLSKLVNESARLVLDQFTEAQKWMNESTEFGAAWVSSADGNVDNARRQIRAHFDTLRQQWAKEWEFFGKVPVAFNRKLLADTYETSLWAGYLLVYILNTLATETVERLIVERMEELNVVMAETDQGKLDQANRMIEGSPRPKVEGIEGSANDLEEIAMLEAWSLWYLTQVAPETERQFFPPARQRTLPPL